MKKTYKFISRLIVGVIMILLALYCIWAVIKGVVLPTLPLKSGATYVQDVSNSMSEPDKTYANNAISEASSDYKIAIVLDYQLTTFAVTDSYIDNIVGTLVNNYYINQPYVVYTYFKDTSTLVITTNIDNTEKDIVDKTKENVDTDAKVVKEILYYQQNLDKTVGLQKFNFNLNSEYARKIACYSVGSIILLILGIGVLPTISFNIFKRKKKASTHSE